MKFFRARGNYNIFFFLVCFLGSTWSGNAQKLYSEEEVNIEKVFIDANKEKILGNYENAAYLYKEVLKQDKTNHAAAYELARIYDVLEKNDKALGSIKMAVAWDGTNPWYQMFLADMLDKNGKYKEAAKIYEDLIEKDSNNEYYYSKWAFFLVKSKAPEKAIKVYDMLENKIGINEELARKKHTLYLGIGNTKKATTEYQQLVRAYPSNIDYRYLLADFYQKVGERDQAIATYKNILEIEPDDAVASLAIAESMKSGGDDISYLNSLKPVFEKPDVDIDLKVKEIIPYIRKVADTGDKNLAIAAIQLSDILEIIHPKEAKSFSVAGDLLYHSGRNKEALEKYKHAISLDNTVYSIHEQIMYIDLELKYYDDLLAISEKAMDIFPNQPKSFYFNGIANSWKNNSMEAINSFQQALMMSRKNPRLKFDLHYRLGSEFHKIKNYKLSDKNFEEALKLNPKDYNLLNNYSFFLAQRGANLQKAKEMAALANELRPQQPTFQDTYGWVLYKMKEYAAAKEWIGKALTTGGEDMPEILEHFGDVLYQLDEVDNAIQYWQKALDKGATSEKLEKKIADKKLYE